MLALGAAWGGGPERTALAVEGALQNPGNGHWYLYVVPGGRVYWHASKSAAEALGGYLATITSSSEQQWAYDNFFSSRRFTFVGATDEVTEGTWQWVNGEAWSYTNWSPGEPNNDYGGTQEYLEIGGSSYGGKWDDANDGSVDVIDGFLVEWDTNPNASAQPPAPPTQLTANYSEVTGVTLAWTDNSTNEDGFAIERKPAGYAFSRRDTTGTNVASYVDLLLYASTTYTYRVRAFNSGGDSAWSNEASITTPVGVPTPVPPLPPSFLTANLDGAVVDVAWTDNSVDETLFGLERAEGNAPFGIRISAPADTVAFEDHAIHPGWPYRYRVRALSLQGPSPYSNLAGATLPATLTVTPGKGSLTDSANLHRDKLKLAAMLADDAALDVRANGLVLQLGPTSAPLAISIPPGDAAWKSRKSKLTWKSAKGVTPKVTVVLDTAKHTLKVTASAFDFGAPPTTSVAVLVASGASGGAGEATWTERKPGALRSP